MLVLLVGEGQDIWSYTYHHPVLSQFTLLIHSPPRNTVKLVLPSGDCLTVWVNTVSAAN